MESDLERRENTVGGQRRLGHIVGLTLIGIGAILLMGVVAFYAFGFYSTSRLDDLNASIEGPLTLPDNFALAEDTSSRGPQEPLNSSEVILPNNSVLHGALLPDGTFKTVEVVKDISSYTPVREPVSPAPREPSPSIAQAANSPANIAGQPDEAAPDESSVFLIANYASVYPGQQIHPKYWDQPLWAGTDPFSFGESNKPEGFQPLSLRDTANIGVLSEATRIQIPSIGVDSSIEPLGIIEKDGKQQYETPVNVVGSIPDTANPGEAGNGWFFGHLESPLKGEGNVFHRLPEIPVLLNNGDPIYVSVESADGEYLYQVVSSKVVKQEDLTLYETDDSTITLVTCSRRPFYDHRQLVTAKLVGFKPSSKG